MKTRDPIVVGVEFRPEGVHAAFLRWRTPRLVGLGIAPYPTGTVVDGDIRRVDHAEQAVATLLDEVHWAEPAVAVAALAPATGSEDQPLIAGQITMGGDTVRLDALARHLDTTSLALAHPAIGRLAFDTAPVAVARFARATQPDVPVVFAAGSTASRHWTLSATTGALDIEIGRQQQAASTFRLGSDPSRMTAPEWGDLRLHRRVRAAFPTPARFVAAVGAALSATGQEPVATLTGPTVERIETTAVGGWWGVERIL